MPTILELSQRSSPRRGGIDEEYPCLRVEVQDGGADGFNESSDSESHRPTTDDERLRPTSSLATGPSGAGLLVKKRANPIDVLVGAVFPDRFASVTSAQCDIVTFILQTTVPTVRIIGRRGTSTTEKHWRDAEWR